MIISRRFQLINLYLLRRLICDEGLTRWVEGKVANKCEPATIIVDREPSIDVGAVGFGFQGYQQQSASGVQTLKSCLI